jgi:hypothetical protein
MNFKFSCHIVARLLAFAILSTTVSTFAAVPVRNEFMKLVPGAHGSPGTDYFQKFGASIDMAGGRVLVGAWGDDTVAADSGAAYLFNATTGQFLNKFTTTQNFSSTIGQSAALYGNSVLTGTPNRTGGRGGIVHLFDATTAVRTRFILPSGVSTFDYYGAPVAVDGTTALVGAFGDDDNGFFAGAAYLMNITNNTLIAKLKPNDALAEDEFGFAVDISNGIAIVGSESNAATVGGAYLFNASTGAQLSKLVPSDGAINDSFGNSVAIDGHYAVVGSRFDDNANGPDAGAAYLFDITNPTAPVQVAKWVPGDVHPSSGFGVSVAISGNYAIVGEAVQTVPGIDMGAAYLFDVGTRSLVTKLLPANNYIAEEFGWSVAIDGTVAAVAAQNDNPDGTSPGAVFLFSVPEPNSIMIAFAAVALLSPGRLIRPLTSPRFRNRSTV